jgi:predicted permease
MSWWQRLIRRRAVERQLDAELRDHVERQVADFVAAGLDEAEARRRAILAFGGLEQIREQCRDARGTRFVEDALRDGRYAARTLAKRPGFVAAALILLALGIGANTTIFSLLDAVLLREVPVNGPDSLYFIAHRHGERSHASSNYPLLERIRDRGDVFAGVTAYALTSFKVASGDSVERVTGEFVTGNYHALVGVRMVHGRGFVAESDRPTAESGVAVISHRYWIRAFNGAAEVVGRSLVVDGRPLSIVGVTAPGFDGFTPGRPSDITLPIALKVADAPDYLTMHDTWTSLVMIGRLAPHVTAQQATAATDVVFGQYLAEPENKWYKADATVLFPARRGSAELRQRYSASLAVLMAMVLVVLLIALANFALLQLARARARAKEMSIRLSIGAGRWRLVRQLLIESLLLACLGGGLGLVLAAWGTTTIAALFRTGQNPVVLNVEVTGMVLAFTAGITLVAGLVFGLTPALAATRFDLVTALKDGPTAAGRIGRRWNVSRLLVAAQVALCLVLLAGAGLLVRTLQNLQAPDGTFDGRSVTLVSVEGRGRRVPDDYWPARCAAFLERLRQQRDIASAACSTSTPLDMAESRRGAMAGATPIPGGVLANVVSPDFFRTFAIPLVKGRAFTEREGSGAPRVGVINERMARIAFGETDPIGRAFNFRATPKEQIEIVGVVRDVRHNPRELASATVYTPLGQGGEIEAWMTVAVRAAGDRAVSAESLRSGVQGVSPDVIVTRQRTFGEQVGALLVRERTLALLSAWFGVLAVVLACVGLYGVMSHQVTQRQQEIGIRLALGADSSRVLAAMLREAAMVAAIGIAMGTATALMLSKLISDLLFEVSARDPFTFAAAAAVLAITTLLAGYLPARRAAGVDPTTVLRSS